MHTDQHERSTSCTRYQPGPPPKDSTRITITVRVEKVLVRREVTLMAGGGTWHREERHAPDGDAPGWLTGLVDSAIQDMVAASKGRA